jgi:hypothetical protein
MSTVETFGLVVFLSLALCLGLAGLLVLSQLLLALAGG